LIPVKPARAEPDIVHAMIPAEPAPAHATPRTPYEALGEAGVRRLVDAFYDLMETDPAAADLRGLHAGDLEPMRARLSDWLIGWMGGPRVYSERHPGRPCVVSAHGQFRIRKIEADQWVACMQKALAETGAPQELKALLEPAFCGMCEALVNA
jgi:hemoglobin